MTESVAIPVDPDWAWDECIYCGSPAVTDRRWLLLNSGRLARAGWCPKRICQNDLTGTVRAVPEQAIPPGVSGGAS